MTKTVCDICGKEMPTGIAKPIYLYKFCISSYGKFWDVCDKCREELAEWIKRRKAENDKEDCKTTECENCINHNDCNYET